MRLQGEAALLRQTFALARRSGGRTSPNPMVGAIVVNGGRVAGRGFHARAGAPHAEVLALARAGRRARGSTLYVNLEPCSHFGRTPPCTDAIIAAGVAEVVACMRDPDPRVDGRGFRALRAAGVKVRVGALLSEARQLNRGFLRRLRTGMPAITLKAGVSLDGRIATRRGASRWITGASARAAARRLRAEHDAVLVGVGTVLADNPRLSAPGGRSPARVILDSRLRTPPEGRLFGDGGEVIVMTLRGASRARRMRLEQAGALVLTQRARDGRVDLRSALRDLARRGIASVLIEGGGEVLGSALDAGIGDRVALFMAPRIVGGLGARPAFAGRGAGRLSQSVSVQEAAMTRVGADWLLEGRLRHPGRSARNGRRVAGSAGRPAARAAV